jgi:dihydroorotate dehydrogenase
MLDLYELAWGPAAAAILRTDPMTAHDRTVALLRGADRAPAVTSVARLLHRSAFPELPITVGGVDLPQPLILSAGLIKGDGFGAEAEALDAVERDRDIVPGWRSAAALLGPVEIGSLTRYPRLGNPGRVLWRDLRTRSMQNRVGLRNPGARSAAAYLAAHATALPPVWGLNLAVSPAVGDPVRSREEIVTAAGFFVDAFAGTTAGPSWVTLNLSCPNTEDDPRGAQSAALAESLAGALDQVGLAPVWVKLGPDLSDQQLEALVPSLAASGVRAVVATNTWAQPVPDGSGQAGVSGRRLRGRALDTVVRLRERIDAGGYELDIVASGGVMDGRDWLAFQAAGARAAMLYSALVFRGPLAGALILREAARSRRHG